MTSIANFISIDRFQLSPNLDDTELSSQMLQYLIAKKEDGSFVFDEIFSDHYSDFIDLYRCFFGLSSGYDEEDLNVHSVRIQLLTPINLCWVGELNRLGEFSMQERYNKFVSSVDDGTFLFYQVVGIDKCHKCGKSLSFELHNWKLVDKTSDFLPDFACIKVGEMTVDVELPTGELVIVSDQPGKIQKAVADFMKDKIGRGMSVNSISGMKNHMQKYAQNNILTVHTSNFSGYFFEYSKDDNAYAIIQTSEEFLELEESGKVNAIWAEASGGSITVIDKQFLLEILKDVNLDENPIKLSGMSIKPGRYKFKTNPKNVLKSREIKNALENLGSEFAGMKAYAELIMIKK